MDSLPAEILQLICKYTGDICGASLRRLALVNRSFYYAALPHIYGCVAIKFFDYTTLEHAVNEITVTPRKKHYREYARRLDILTLPETWGQIALADTRVHPSRTPKLKEFIDISEFIPDVANLNLTEKILAQWRTPSLDTTTPEPLYYEERNWQPLVMLLTSLNRLRTLNYAVGNNFPSCLLEAIHQYHPDCQLNIWSAQSIALDIPDMGSVQLSKLPKFQDPFEINLFRSPCLSAIKIYYASGYNREHRISVEQDAIIPLVSMAPNLRYLQVQSSAGRKILESNDKWKNFMASFGPLPTAPPRPATLSFCRGSFGSERLVEKWSQYFNFSFVQALDIGRIQNVSETASFFSQLRKLERLFINLDQPQIGVSPGYLQEADYATIFGSINPLKCLRIRGLNNKLAIYTMLEYHGETLQDLIIEPGQSQRHTDDARYHSYPALAYDDILNFAKKAPGIRQLRLALERSKGNSSERLFYEALGAFPCLHILTLDLHYQFQHEGEGAEVNNAITTPRNDSSSYHTRLEEAFRNAAMDESLATEIWHLICSNQNNEKLQKLRIVPFGWDLFPNKAVREILLHLSRSFLISKRGPEYGLEIVQIGREETLLQAEREIIFNREPNSTWSPPTRLRQLIKSLWQLSEPEIDDWTRHWKSFPLDANNEGTT